MENIILFSRVIIGSLSSSFSTCDLPQNRPVIQNIIFRIFCNIQMTLRVGYLTRVSKNRNNIVLAKNLLQSIIQLLRSVFTTFKLNFTNSLKTETFF